MRIPYRFLITGLKGMGLHSKTGEDWYHQRLTSLFLLGLLPWLFINGLGNAGGMGYHDFGLWIKNPTNAILLSLIIIFVFSHGRLGMESIVEDYIHHKFWYKAALYTVRIGCKFLMLLGVISIIYSSIFS